ncbi:MAG: hypothetical protein B5766_05105 [Candidatus Lumbricidophila eiseniae]|uniref:Short-chain dehydrogenase n=1 Tax=Candidatus Lumbricidiphila eiseniae TaxID=1969409 RepID=A0A2A6FRV0_9MICO|nr:MAG: hypothetical protein B5766_05105 [Candidatus Lumbricidophila eiseniae]
MSELDHTLDFSGIRAVVTGGSHGIGAACATLLRNAGATVIVLDIDAGPEVIVVDLANRAEVAAAAETSMERLGGVDVLVNVAGIFRPSPVRGLSLEAYDATMAVNLTAPVMLMSLFAEPMATQKYGRIVNITSIHAKLSESLSLAYDASKGGLESATRTAALELADAGVLVNAVAPGFVATRMSLVDGQDELNAKPFTDIYVGQGRLPLRRAAQPSEIAHTVAFLASKQNSYITGQVVTIDGGLSARF